MSYPAYYGEIMWVPYDFAPDGWAKCEGQLLSIFSNQALFSLIGTLYGGDGRTNFALPDLRGHTPIGVSAGSQPGTKLGAETHTLKVEELPQHTHAVGVSDARATEEPAGLAGTVRAGGSRASVDRAGTQGTMAPTAVSAVGDGQPHNNMQPYLTLNAIIRVGVDSIFPSQT